MDGRMGVLTISGIIEQVCQAIWNSMREEYMEYNPARKSDDISQGFLKNSDSPKHISGVDAKRTSIIEPAYCGSLNMCDQHIHGY